jgi:hypothetical protein
MSPKWPTIPACLDGGHREELDTNATTSHKMKPHGLSQKDQAMVIERTNAQACDMRPAKDRKIDMRNTITLER